MKIARDVFISNVIVQVEERHFLRKIHRLIPDDLDLDAIKMLAKEEEASVRDMDRLAKEKKMLEDAYKAIRDCR